MNGEDNEGVQSVSHRFQVSIVGMLFVTTLCAIEAALLTLSWRSLELGVAPDVILVSVGYTLCLIGAAIYNLAKRGRLLAALAVVFAVLAVLTAAFLRYGQLLVVFFD